MSEKPIKSMSFQDPWSDLKKKYDWIIWNPMLSKSNLMSHVMSEEEDEEEEETSISGRGPTWMKCMFVPPLDLCPWDIGIAVKNM